MPTVREASFDLFRARGMTTIFGNPGSTELPMLAGFPDDFDYVLGLQELGMVGNQFERFRRLIQEPHGIVLVTGPTGSGKTTTLYAALNEIYSEEKKIIATAS